MSKSENTPNQRKPVQIIGDRIGPDPILGSWHVPCPERDFVFVLYGQRSLLLPNGCQAMTQVTVPYPPAGKRCGISIVLGTGSIIR